MEPCQLGYKWNAYNSSYTTSNGVTEILFHTAWSPPFPVIVAFANTFKIDFEHRYCEGSQSFWGIEQWKYDPKEKIAFASSAENLSATI